MKAGQASDIAKRVEALERRARELEDRMAIYQLIATYGPAADSCDERALSSLWTDDGVFDADHYVFRGTAELKTIVRSPTHAGYIEQGCAHIMSFPHITLQGDRAIATNHSRVYIYDMDCWRVRRVSANRWELERTQDGWRVRYRLNRLLNGRKEVSAILGQELWRDSSSESDWCSR